LEKEELMKTLTTARDDGDFIALLRLHVEVMGSGEGDQRQLFNDTTVKTLTAQLAERARAVEREILSLRRSDPMLGQIAGLTEVASLDRALIRESARQHAAGIREHVSAIEQQVVEFQRDGKALVAFLISRPHEEDEETWNFSADSFF